MKRGIWNEKGTHTVFRSISVSELTKRALYKMFHSLLATQQFTERDYKGFIT